MRKYTQAEIETRAKSLFVTLVSSDSLENAKRIIRTVRLLLAEEEKRRVNLKGANNVA